MNADVLTTRVADRIAVITLGSAKRIYFDAEMGDALTAALDGFAGDANVRVVVVTGGAPGYFIRHYSIAALISLAESLRASGREWPENATYNSGFLDKAIALCESMPKPVIASISGTALTGDSSSRCPAIFVSLRMATTRSDSWSRTLDSFPAPAARKGCRAPSEHQLHSCTSSWAIPSLHVKQKVRDWCTKPSAARLSIARCRLRGACCHSRPNRSLTSSVSSATPRRRRWRKAWRSNLFLKLCVSESALARMRSYEEENITSPSRSIEVEARRVSYE
jgi:hypothetical protein